MDFAFILVRALVVGRALLLVAAVPSIKTERRMSMNRRLMCVLEYYFSVLRGSLRENKSILVINVLLIGVFVIANRYVRICITFIKMIYIS